MVITACKAIVLSQPDDSNLWILPLQEVQRVVAGSIVGNDHGGIATSMGHDRGQVLLKHLPPVPVQYDNSYFHLVAPSVNSHFRAVRSWLKSPSLTTIS